MPDVSEDTAAFLLTVLAGLTLHVGAADFDDTARAVLTARAELQPAPPQGGH